MSDDGLYCHCSREELAGGISITTGSGTYAHRLEGECKCGTTHGIAAAPQPLHTIAKVYDYLDAHGVVVHQTIRYEPKRFSQRRPDPEKPGSWIWDLKGIITVLYNLPSLLASPKRRVFLVEGEKDAHTLTDIGLLATCNAMGAGKWQPQYSETLRGRHVVLIADKDDRGRDHAELVRAGLEEFAASFLVLELPDIGAVKVKDASDWVTAGGTRDDLEQLVRKAEAASEPFHGSLSAAEVLATEHEEPVALIDGLLYEGATLFAAAPKLGKSTTALNIAANIASGGLAFGSLPCKQAGVLYLSMEDELPLVKKRLLALLQGKPAPDDLRIEFEAHTMTRLPGDIRGYVVRHPETKLVIIDTLARARVGVEQDRSKRTNLQDLEYQEILPFKSLANQLHIAILIVAHSPKAQYGDPAANVAGSFGLLGATHASMQLSRQRGEDSAAVLTVQGRHIDSDNTINLAWDRAMRSYVGVTPPSVEDQARAAERAIVAFLEQHKDAPQSIKRIATATGLSDRLVKERCGCMADASTIRRTSHGWLPQTYPTLMRVPLTFGSDPDEDYLNDIAAEVSEPRRNPFPRVGYE